MFRPKAKVIVANFTASALDGRASYRINLLGCEASLFEDRKCPVFNDHGRRIGMVLLLLVGFRPELSLDMAGTTLQSSMDIFFHAEEDGADSI